MLVKGTNDSPINRWRSTDILRVTEALIKHPALVSWYLQPNAKRRQLFSIVHTLHDDLLDNRVYM